MIVPVIFTLVATVQAHLSCSVPQHVIVQNNVQLCCQQNGGSWSYQPQACIGLDGQGHALGSTTVEHIQNGLAFVYKCSEDSSTGGWSYDPIACSTSANSGVQYNPGENFSSDNFQYICEHDSDGSLSVRPVACLSNGQTYEHGSTVKVCDQNGNCQNFQCTIQGMNANFSCQSCQIGNQVVQTGQQVIWQQRQCYCQQSGIYCHGWGI